MAEKVELLDAKKKENATNEKQDAPVQKEQSDPFKEFGNEVEIDEDSLPF